MDLNSRLMCTLPNTAKGCSLTVLQQLQTLRLSEAEVKLTKFVTSFKQLGRPGCIVGNIDVSPPLIG